jgi:hypothetical protein
MLDKKIDQQVIKFLMKLKKPAPEVFNLCKVYGENTLSGASECEQHKRFSKGKDMEDDE